MGPTKPARSSPEKCRPATFTRNPAYPPRATTVPAGTSLVEICANYPNHLAGDGLDRFFGIMKARSIYDNMPTVARNQTTSITNKANFIQKRLDNRRYQLIRDRRYNAVIRENYRRENMLMDDNELIDEGEERKNILKKDKKTGGTRTKKKRSSMTSGARHQTLTSLSPPFKSIGLSLDIKSEEDEDENEDESGDESDDSDDEGEDDDEEEEEDAEYRPRHRRQVSNQRLQRISSVADQETEDESDNEVSSGPSQQSLRVVLRLSPAALRQVLGEEEVTNAGRAQPRASPLSTTTTTTNTASSVIASVSPTPATAVAPQPILDGPYAHPDSAVSDPHAAQIGPLHDHLEGVLAHAINVLTNLATIQNRHILPNEAAELATQTLVTNVQTCIGSHQLITPAARAQIQAADPALHARDIHFWAAAMLQAIATSWGELNASTHLYRTLPARTSDDSGQQQQAQPLSPARIAFNENRMMLFALTEMSSVLLRWSEGFLQRLEQVVTARTAAELQAAVDGGRVGERDVPHPARDDHMVVPPVPFVNLADVMLNPQQ